jgi:hypothetical protein
MKFLNESHTINSANAHTLFPGRLYLLTFTRHHQRNSMLGLLETSMVSVESLGRAALSSLAEFWSDIVTHL